MYLIQNNLVLAYENQFRVITELKKEIESYIECNLLGGFIEKSLVRGSSKVIQSFLVWGRVYVMFRLKMIQFKLECIIFDFFKFILELYIFLVLVFSCKVLYIILIILVIFGLLGN